MQGTLTACFLVFSITALTTSSPVKRRSLPCQGNTVVHSLLREAMVLSNELARQSSNLGKEMSKRWPTDPYEESNVDFFIPLGSWNKTGRKPLRILKANCRILRRFISLLDNSTNDLSRFPVAGGVRNQLVQLKHQIKTLINCLRRIMANVKSQERAQSDKGRKKTSTPEDRMTTSSSNIGSPTIENVTLRTKLILDDLYAKCHDLMSDLIQTCN